MPAQVCNHFINHSRYGDRAAQPIQSSQPNQKECLAVSLTDECLESVIIPSRPTSYSCGDKVPMNLLDSMIEGTILKLTLITYG